MNKWIAKHYEHGSYGFESFGIPRYTSKNEAELLVSAVNGCIEVNPDTPQSAAKAIPAMYEALKAAQEGTGDWRAVVDLALAEAEEKL